MIKPTIRIRKAVKTAIGSVKANELELLKKYSKPI